MTTPHRIVVKALFAQIPTNGDPIQIQHHADEPILIEIDAIGFVDCGDSVMAVLSQDHSSMPAAYGKVGK